MSLCTVCGRVYCDHTAEQRGQTEVEMARELTPTELEAFNAHPDATGYIPEKIAAAKASQAEAVATQATLRPLHSNATWDSIKARASELGLSCSGFGSEGSQLGWEIGDRRFYLWQSDLATILLNQRLPDPVPPPIPQ